MLTLYLLACALEAKPPGFEKACESTTWWGDADGDGFGNAGFPQDGCEAPAGHVANADDCDDLLAGVYPGAAEHCDDLDEDCDGSIDESARDLVSFYTDADGDGYGDDETLAQACTAPAGTTPGGGDCDDTDPLVTVETTVYADADDDDWGEAASPSLACEVGAGQSAMYGDCDVAEASANPDSTETCDGIDNDCDGTIDGGEAGDQPLWCRDRDGDGWGNDAETVAACDLPEGYVADCGDCDDTSAAISPSATETCSGLDEDCDTLIDADDPDMSGLATWYLDADGDDHGASGDSIESCERPAGYALDPDDCDDDAATVFPGADETCNDIDDDCDSTVDDNAIDALEWHADADADGHGDAASSTAACDPPADFLADASDCDDGDAAVFPGADETCDTLDNDCDGTVDEADWYADTDRDGYGDALTHDGTCEAPAGYVADDTDCDDSRAGVNPAATEACDADDLDEDCDTLRDDADDTATSPTDWYADDDGDTFGAGGAVAACDAPAGHTDNDDDCDDTRSDVSPAGTETCDDDDVDEDCNGLSDDDDSAPAGTFMFYADADADGYGTAASTAAACTAPSGFADNADDCDDSNSAIAPDAYETCNDGIDQDCDGLDVTVCDADGDGYDVSTDCDDANADINPAEREVCDAADTDEDCDGNADNNDSSASSFTKTRYYRDTDGDGYGDDTHSGALSCDAPSAYSASNDDCDDADATVSPGESEVCADAVDNDCSGDVDDCTFRELGDGTAVLTGASSGSFFGWSVAAGDTDGDGVSELIVADPYDDRTAASGGAIYIFGAGASGAVGAASATTVIQGVVHAGGFGYEGVTTGDLDADGLADVFAYTDYASGTGVFYGSGVTSGATTETAYDTAFTLQRPVLLDMDGDGLLEVAGPGASGSWIAHVFSGPYSAGGALYSYYTDAVCEFAAATSTSASQDEAHTLDANSDGIDDLVLNARMDGSTYIYTSGCAGPMVPGDAEVVFVHSGSGDFVMLATGDLDGDGSDDLVIAQQYTIGSDAVAVSVVPGPMAVGTAYVSAVASMTVTSLEASTALGGPPTAADVDADGIDDLIVGYTYYGDGSEGAELVAWGGWSGALAAEDLIYPAYGAFLYGGSGGSGGGQSVTAVPDYDGDGGAELLMGSYYGSNTAWYWLSSDLVP